ncbi:MAG: cysteine--tRNA ligase [Thermoprotei archaeon]
MKLYNTLSRRVEELLIDGGPIRIYVCGLTPQDHIHVGHARTFVVFDLLRRFLEYRGQKVIYVQNFTDIDDKIIAKAKELGIQPSEVSEKYIQEYFEVMDRLNVLRAHYYPRVTQNIPEIIDFINGLISRGYAYVSDGDVYFEVRKFREYGKLSHQKLDDLIVGARVEPSEKKRNPEDFALWKSASSSEIGWTSPWGKGRPGWHIECSTMIKKYLGDTINIHGGGQDLVFPHHENEVAQSEALTGKPLAHHWVHVGWVTMGRVKMSKSVGNVVNLVDLLERRDANAIRLALINTHYRGPMEFDEDTLDQAEANIRRISAVLFGLHQKAAKGGRDEGIGLKPTPKEVLDQFLAHLEEDLDTPRALGTLFEFIRSINTALSTGSLTKTDADAALEVLNQMLGVLGLELERPSVGQVAEKLIEIILELREEARMRRDYATADKIRLKLAELGILIEDTKEGPRWRVKQ